MPQPDPKSPVSLIPADNPAQPLRDPSQIALCLSGGGYRAMLFHLGAIWRLNELGYLGKLHRISSVSGGSITAGVLAAHWASLGVTDTAPAPNFPIIVSEIRKLADHTIDIGSVLEGIFGPGTVSMKIQNAYDDMLFHGKTLQDLPDDPPRFVFKRPVCSLRCYGGSRSPSWRTIAWAWCSRQKFRWLRPWQLHPRFRRSSLRPPSI